MEQGYYFASTQEASQIDIAKAVGKILSTHGLLEATEPKTMSLEQVNGMLGHRLRGFASLGAYMFAANSRTRPHRAEKLFGYAASAPTFWDTLEDDVLAAAGKK
jgi:hypothetical protein